MFFSFIYSLHLLQVQTTVIMPQLLDPEKLRPLLASPGTIPILKDFSHTPLVTPIFLMPLPRSLFTWLFLSSMSLLWNGKYIL